MPSNIPAIVIAAGGDAARMGGDKPDRLLGGMRLIDRAVTWAQRHSDTIALAVRQDMDDWDTGLPLLYDRQGNSGPISALLSALHFANSEERQTVLMIGCDQPFLPDDLIARLDEALPERGAALPKSNERAQPMAALWRAEPKELECYIESGKRSLMGFAELIGMQLVGWDNTPDPFLNINDPATLAEANQRLQ